MRPYNPQTDFHIITKSVANTDLVGEQRSLKQIANDLQAAGIAWPENFNQDPQAEPLDRDICRAWGW